MNLDYAIFRSEPIYTLQDLAQIGSHNKREKQAYNSNPDIKIELSKNNVELVPLADKYVKGLKMITKEYEKEHNERMKTEREDRKKTFTQMLNKSKNVVADELLFTSSNKFFKDMSKEDILKWANCCMEFVYEDLGYTKEQVLHSTLHLDELTPHIHCVVVPLIKKYDNRTKTKRYTISKKQYIKDKLHLSELQDKYHQRLVNNGFDLERGIKGSDSKNLKIKELKKVTRYYEQKTNTINEKIDNAINDFEEKMKTTKNTIIDKEYVKVKKDTFESMQKVIKETKNAMEIQPKVQELFKEVNTYTVSHHKLENEVEVLKTKNKKLEEKNKRLESRFKDILNTIKEFFRDLLLYGTKLIKEATTDKIKVFFNERYFESDDVYEVAKNTDKEDELFDYADISYLKLIMILMMMNMKKLMIKKMIWKLVCKNRIIILIVHK